MRKLSILLACIMTLGLLFGVMPASATSENLYPDNLFSSAEVCGEYFTYADQTGTTYEEVDGEYIMTMPIHSGLNYMCSTNAVPYESFTVSFDFYLIISPDSHFHEADFLFGMTGGPKPFHQASIVATGGSLYLKHYTLEEEWYEYKEDESFYDVYDEEAWNTFTAEITADGVSIYLNDEYLTDLTDTEGCIGEKGYIGLRAGSAGGWKIKNLKVVEGIAGDEPTEEPTVEPTEEPTVEPTEAPTEKPTVESTEEVAVSATPDNPEDVPATQAPSDDTGNGFPWVIVGIVAVILVAGGIVCAIVVKKKSKA